MTWQPRMRKNGAIHIPSHGEELQARRDHDSWGRLYAKLTPLITRSATIQDLQEQVSQLLTWRAGGTFS